MIHGRRLRTSISKDHPINANNVIAQGSVVGAGAMGYVLDHGGMMSALALTMGSMLLTALLTLPFLRSHAVDATQAVATS